MKTINVSLVGVGGQGFLLTANMFNGLTPDDFRRRHSYVAFTQGDLAETKATIEAFAQVEGLDAHGRAASIRFE